MALALGPPGVGRRSGRAASSDRSWRFDPISRGPERSGPPDGPCRMRWAHGANAARASTSSPRWAVICDSQDTAVQHGFRRRRTTDFGPGHALDAQLPGSSRAGSSRAGSSRAGSSMSGLDVGPRCRAVRSKWWAPARYWADELEVRAQKTPGAGPGVGNRGARCADQAASTSRSACVASNAFASRMISVRAASRLASGACRFSSTMR